MYDMHGTDRALKHVQNVRYSLPCTLSTCAMCTARTAEVECVRYQCVHSPQCVQYAINDTGGGGETNNGETWKSIDSDGRIRARPKPIKGTLDYNKSIRWYMNCSAFVRRGEEHFK